MKTYKVRTGCEIAGRWRNAGAPIVLSEKQARELLPPLGNVLIPETVSEGGSNAKLRRNQRRNRRRPQ